MRLPRGRRRIASVQAKSHWAPPADVCHNALAHEENKRCHHQDRVPVEEALRKQHSTEQLNEPSQECNTRALTPGLTKPFGSVRERTNASQTPKQTTLRSTSTAIILGLSVVDPRHLADAAETPSLVAFVTPRHSSERLKFLPGDEAIDEEVGVCEALARRRKAKLNGSR